MSTLRHEDRKTRVHEGPQEQDCGACHTALGLHRITSLTAFALSGMPGMPEAIRERISCQHRRLSQKRPLLHQRAPAKPQHLQPQPPRHRQHLRWIKAVKSVLRPSKPTRYAPSIGFCLDDWVENDKLVGSCFPSGKAWSSRPMSHT